MPSLTRYATTAATGTARAAVIAAVSARRDSHHPATINTANTAMP
ncbi:hypothetical protein [Rhodococcus sp. ZPP]